MLTLVSRQYRTSCSRLGLAVHSTDQPMEMEEKRIVRQLRRLAAARLQAQHAFERDVHVSETLQADLDSALEQGKDDLARRLIQVLFPISLEHEALSRQVEAIDLESKALRSRLRHLRRLCPSRMEPCGSPEFAEQWLDAELHKRKAAIQDTFPEDE